MKLMDNEVTITIIYFKRKEKTNMCFTYLIARAMIHLLRVTAAL